MRISAVSVIVALSSAPTGLCAVPQPDLAGFESVVTPFLERYCFDCHDDLSTEGGLSLLDIDADLLAGADYETWRMIDDQVRFGEMPPKDKRQPEAQERQAVLTWIRGELLKTQYPGVVTVEKLLLPQFGNYVDHQYLFGKRLPRVYPAPPRLWRLRPEIYEAKMSLRQVEGELKLANGLTRDDGSQFKDYAASYFIDEAATAPLLGNARKLAAALLDSKRSKNGAIKALASDAGKPDADAVARALEEIFVLALGRRPAEAEAARFLDFYEEAEATGGYRVAAQALLVAVLMQPEFFYRSELGDGEPDEHGRLRLAAKEIAYALSYALFDEPDESFQQAASEGQLATADGVRDVVRARLESEGPARIRQFFREYFHYPFAVEVFKDPPPGGEHDARMLVADLEMTIQPILAADREVLAELLTSREFFVNATWEREAKDESPSLVRRNEKTRKYQTAFNLPIDWKWSAHLQPVEFAEGERAGILTHPAWLVAWSGNFENHPVQRGKWIRTHLLGGTVPDVPIGVDARVPEMEHRSFRERLGLATEAAECWRCHKKMDPLGVAFERYDHYGRYQRLDAGQPVDASGLIDRTGVPELDGTRVAGPTEMMEILARSEHVEQVFVRHAFRFFLGRNETLGDANTLQDAHQAYRDNDGSFRALVVSLLGSDSFLYREQPTENR